MDVQAGPRPCHTYPRPTFGLAPSCWYRPFHAQPRPILTGPTPSMPRTLPIHPKLRPHTGPAPPHPGPASSLRIQTQLGPAQVLPALMPISLGNWNEAN